MHFVESNVPALVFIFLLTGQSGSQKSKYQMSSRHFSTAPVSVFDSALDLEVVVVIVVVAVAVGIHITNRTEMAMLATSWLLGDRLETIFLQFPTPSL